MYKQIIPHIPPSLPSTDDYIHQYLQDEVLMNRSAQLTDLMLSNNMNIDRICAIIKEYQTKYIYIKKNDTKLAELFTPEMWWKTRN